MDRFLTHYVRLAKNIDNGPFMLLEMKYPRETFSPTPSKYLQNTYIKNKFLASAILHRDGASKAV